MHIYSNSNIIYGVHWRFLAHSIHELCFLNPTQFRAALHRNTETLTSLPQKLAST